MILTEQDLERALNKDHQETLNKLIECADLILKGGQMLVENKLSEKDYQILQEGLWEKAKYYMSKLGRYKAGGKIFGKGKIDQEAGAKIQAILDKKGNEVIKLLDASIKKTDPNFPDGKDEKQFLTTVMEISAIYDSIVAATKKSPQEEGFLPIDAANSIIADLAEYVKKYLDVDLTARGSIFDSIEDQNGLLSEEGTDTSSLYNVDRESIKVGSAADVRKGLKPKAGDVKYRSTRMDTLGSSRLPLFLNIGGGLIGLAGWVVQTDWFREMFTKIEHLPAEEHSKIITSYVNQNVNIDPNGFSYTLQNNLPTSAIEGSPEYAKNAIGLSLGPKAPVENLKRAVEFYGQGDADKGIEVMCKQFLDPSVQKESIINLKAQLADSSNKTVNDVFTHAEKTYGSPGELFRQANPSSVKGFIISILTSKVVTWLSTGATVASIPFGIGKLIAAGPLLGKVGVGLILTGALVKLMRMKGKKQSRAATLNDLLQSLQPVKATEASEENQSILPNPKPNPIEDIIFEPVSDDISKINQNKKWGNKQQVYNDLAGFFKYVYNNRKFNAPEVFGETGKKDYCSNFKVGTIVVDTEKNKEYVVIDPMKWFKDKGTAEATLKNNKEQGRIEVRRLINGKPKGGPHNKQCSELKLVNKATNESVIHNNKLINEVMNSLISEGKFIKDPETIKILKKSGIDQRKLKFFEGFLTRLEIIRNKVKKMDETGDNVLDRFVKKLKVNPIMTKDFVKTFNVDSGNPQNVEAMGRFINEIIEIVYKGKFRGLTVKDVNGMIEKTPNKLVDKMGTLGGGNINKVSSIEEAYLLERKGKKAKTKSQFKNNIISFITDLMGMFQYMNKLKRQGKLTSEKSKQTEKQKPSREKESEEIKTESIKRTNNFLKEEVRRIKSLMAHI